MGCLIEILMEAVFEGVAYGYAWLMTLIIPKHKLSKKAFDIIKSIVIVFAIIVLGVAIAGLIMWLDNAPDSVYSKAGRIMFIISAVIMVAQIILGIISKIVSKENKIEGEEDSDAL